VPLQDKAQFEKVKGYLEDAKPDGIIVAGGEALRRKGYFIVPTIVRDIPDTSRLLVEADGLPRFGVRCDDAVCAGLTFRPSTPAPPTG
jgi:hypothetical protein